MVFKQECCPFLLDFDASGMMEHCNRNRSGIWNQTYTIQSILVQSVLIQQFRLYRCSALLAFGYVADFKEPQDTESV
jgi:hypothetical protein